MKIFKIILEQLIPCKKKSFALSEDTDSMEYKWYLYFKDEVDKEFKKEQYIKDNPW